MKYSERKVTSTEMLKFFARLIKVEFRQLVCRVYHQQ